MKKSFGNETIFLLNKFTREHSQKKKKIERNHKNEKKCDKEKDQKKIVERMEK